MIPTAPVQTALTVSELNRQVKRLLEVSYARVWVSGEISGLSRPSSGHWYFTLKDDAGQVRCAMFKGFNQKLKFMPRDGDEVRVLAKVSLYEGRGEFQLIVENIEPAGLGALQAAYEQLRQKLALEGLFDAQRKRPLPYMPKRVVVITSATGAVIHDILSVCERRFPLLEIVLIPVAVQGENAKHEIVAALALANRLRLGDVIIVGRGGGSLEDLWAFNEEIVVRAIADSTLPTISAVGHETDTTLADMAADYRAPTPSAAAERITPDQFELMQSLDQTQLRLQFLITRRLQQEQQSLLQIRKRLKSPTQVLAEIRQRIQELAQRLAQQMQRQLTLATLRLERSLRLLQAQRPERQLALQQDRVLGLFQRLERAQRQLLTTHQSRLHLAARTLHAASPLATLGRGYAVAFDAHRQVLQDAAQLDCGDRIEIQLRQGRVEAEVIRVLNEGLDQLDELPSSTSRA